MADDDWLQLPEHVVAKIEKVLGIPPSELPEYDLVKLIEELCDTALMFDREDRHVGQARQRSRRERRPVPPRPSPESDH